MPDIESGGANNMRVMIGYNGSSASSAVLEDISFAGLPPNSDIRMVVVADPLVYPIDVSEAESLATSASDELRRRFPLWKLETRILEGDAASEIMGEAEAFLPDLIMLGEPGMPDNEGKFRLGVVSRRVIGGTTGSVRISRSPGIREVRPTRIVVGYDGTVGAKCAIDAILSRAWPDGVEIRLVSIADAAIVATIGRFAPQIKDLAVSERYVLQWAVTLCEASRKRLEDANISSEVAVRFGNPADGILSEAFDWRADAILVGPHSASSIRDRDSLGRVSAAVAAVADRSVEICRCPS
jgi:nucleotide-binding universal stress UspA family protein